MRFLSGLKYFVNKTATIPLKMRITLTLSIIIASVILFDCSSPVEKIANPLDYAIYLDRVNDEALQRCNEEMGFWSAKLSEVPDSETYRVRLAGLLSSRFALTGRIEDIQSSDSLYQLILNSTGAGNASIHRAIAGNAITQHQFREARKEILKAFEIGEGKASSLFMQVDVEIELGNYSGAKTALQKIADKNFFPYLIREAKIKDHEGKLDTAILLMEKALEKVKENPSLFLWTQSNLADMYGHAGRVKESYNAYISVLKQNPDYDYALKGIAWIAFSHDRNFAEARRIANHINSKRATPDMHLFLAEISGLENNPDEKTSQLKLFRQAATARKYGDMYNKYLALLDAEEFSNPSGTILIAQKEIQNRPTPQSYDLLAWGYFRQGNIKEALSVAQKYIENRTYEPDALYHLGMIYEANGFSKEARFYLEQAAASSFELGPVIAKEIQEHLNS